MAEIKSQEELEVKIAEMFNDDNKFMFDSPH